MQNNSVGAKCISDLIPCYIENIFSDKQWSTIEALIQEIVAQPILLEAVTKGRGYLEATPFSLQLYTFIARNQGVSTTKDSKYTKQILSILAESHLLKKLSELTGKKVSVLRMQLNIMNSGGYVSQHTDYDSDYAYFYSVLVRPKCEYTGGELVLHHEDQVPNYIRQSDRSILVMSSRQLHSVEAVLSGNRYTICLFCG
jgi:Rps23 Pro-64 3,4-dihydroxylase Tpa1-like proline 4-hydroxylase